ncbi:GTP-dependent dephospho-CoA kinase family protein [Candidatus Pyrohabitans sp.]
MKDLKLPDELRSYLRKPLGELFTGAGIEAMEQAKQKLGKGSLIVVGDESYRNALKLGLKPKLAVVDFRVKREGIEEYALEGEVRKVRNPPGWITRELWDAIHEALNSEGEQVILVEGEEDLAVLPCIIEAEWGDDIIYGQPGEGVVLIHVDDDAKFNAGSIFKVILSRDEWSRG